MTSWMIISYHQNHKSWNVNTLWLSGVDAFCNKNRFKELARNNLFSEKYRTQFMLPKMMSPTGAFKF